MGGNFWHLNQVEEEDRGEEGRVMFVTGMFANRMQRVLGE